MFQPHFYGDSFSLMFELCGHMDMLHVDARLWGKCESYNNLATFNCANEQFGECKNCTSERYCDLTKIQIKLILEFNTGN